jgi:hypothetical protein
VRDYFENMVMQGAHLVVSTKLKKCSILKLEVKILIFLLSLTAMCKIYIV